MTPALPPRSTESAETADVVVRAREALENVTAGPWVAWKQRPGPRDEGGIYPGNVVSDATKQIVVTQTGNTANSEFVAAARSLIPELIAEIEELRAVLFIVKEARVDYEAALFRREHGGVAADRFIRAVTAELDSAAGVS